MAVEAQAQRKRKKNFYVATHGRAGNKRAKFGNYLDSSSGHGFLLTINPKQERRATLTAYTLLNEAADRLYGSPSSPPPPPSQQQQPKQADSIGGPPPADNKADQAPNDGDIESELKALREDNFRFKKLRTEIPSIVFISTKLPKPQELSTDLFTHLPPTVQNIVRLLPVAATCKTQPECVSKKVLELLAEQYPVVLSKMSFLVQLKARHNDEYNSSETRRSFCLQLAKKIQEWNEDFVPDLKEPELVINIDILQKVCCISFLPHYLRFKKYNPEQFNAAPPEPASENSNTKKEQNETTLCDGKVRAATVEKSPVRSVAADAPLESSFADGTAAKSEVERPADGEIKPKHHTEDENASVATEDGDQRA